MNSNPICPSCAGETGKYGKTKAGSQRYKCKSCGKVHTPTSEQGAPGRPAIGEQPMTDAERQKKRYDSLTEEERKEANAKRNAARKKRDQEA